MKHAHLLVALTAFTAMSVSGLAIAQSSTPAPAQAAGDQAATPTPSFEDLDKKNRGYLQRGDLPKDIAALGKLRAHFTEADVNHDGHISKAEFDAYVIPTDVGMNRGSSPRPGVMGGSAGSVGGVGTIAK